MRLYRTEVTLRKITYENGYDMLVLTRDGYRNLDEIPEIIEVDYWEVFDD
ncbi:hypothetical protein SEA_LEEROYJENKINS_88 [Microbacterium phage LeeroyJenkins]|nr:hypothetical protein SEA_LEEROYJENKINS_88 [Microbacterium phage LeeroyJenkins]